MVCVGTGCPDMPAERCDAGALIHSMSGYIHQTSVPVWKSSTDHRHVGLVNLFSSLAQGLDQQLPVFMDTLSLAAEHRQAAVRLSLFCFPVLAAVYGHCSAHTAVVPRRAPFTHLGGTLISNCSCLSLQLCWGGYEL